MMKSFVDSKRCRRKTLVCGMGGECDNPTLSVRCCEFCSPSAISSVDQLNVLELGKAVRSKK